MYANSVEIRLDIHLEGISLQHAEFDIIGKHVSALLQNDTHSPLVPDAVTAQTSMSPSGKYVLSGTDPNQNAWGDDIQKQFDALRNA
jgi:hypothetical protein